MKRLVLLVVSSLLALLIACQPQTPAPEATEPAQPAVTVTETTQPAPTETAAPEATATETVAVATETAVAPTASPTPEPSEASGFLCPAIARPALALSIPGEGHLILDPLSGETCQPDLGDAGLYQAAAGAIFFTTRQTLNEGDALVINQLSPAGERPLAFTAVDVADSVSFHNFVVSRDGSTLAWAAGAPAEDEGGDIVSQMWIGETATGDAWTPLPPYEPEGGNDLWRVMTPVRFSGDNSVLYYTLQPYGIGGAWNAFAGRYDNLYALRLRSEAPPELLFDCRPLNVTLCLGDFYTVDGALSALAYVDAAGNLVVENGAGEVINTLDVDAGYVAYPTWGPGGELVFYAADIVETDGPPQPSEAAIYRVAPPTAPAEVLASDPGLLFPQAWLDETHVVAGYSEGDNWGTALVDLNGNLQVLDIAANATFVTVLPPGDDQALSPLGEVNRYVDDMAGVALDYPADWSVLDVDPAVKSESAIYAVSFFSWEPEETGQGGRPEGGTKIDLVVISDTTATSLEEAIAERRAQMAQMEPPEVILGEERLRLANGLEAVRWLVESRDEQAVVYLTFVNGRVIMVSGLGDFMLIDAIGRTLEPLPVG